MSSGKSSRGGEKSSCGWLKDKFGLSWQIVPTILSQLVQDNIRPLAKSHGSIDEDGQT